MQKQLGFTKMLQNAPDFMSALLNFSEGTLFNRAGVNAAILRIHSSRHEQDPEPHGYPAVGGESLDCPRGPSLYIIAERIKILEGVVLLLWSQLSFR